MAGPEAYDLTAAHDDTPSASLFKVATRRLLAPSTRFIGGTFVYRAPDGTVCGPAELRDSHPENITGSGKDGMFERQRLLELGAAILTIDFKDSPIWQNNLPPRSFALYRPGVLSRDYALGAQLADAAPPDWDPNEPLVVQRSGAGFNPYRPLEDPFDDYQLYELHNGMRIGLPQVQPRQ